jgi:hypothetical protein
MNCFRAFVRLFLAAFCWLVNSAHFPTPLTGSMRVMGISTLHASSERRLFTCSKTCFTSSALIPTLRLTSQVFIDRLLVRVHTLRQIHLHSIVWLAMLQGSLKQLSGSYQAAVDPFICSRCFSPHSSVFSKLAATPSRFTTATSE